MAKRTVVKDDGHKACKLLVIGEAPGKDEMAMGYPFAGASGRMLGGWFNQVGLKRSEAYITNVLEAIPPAKDGNIDAALKSGALTREGIAAGFAYVENLASELPDLSVICPIGNYASYPFCPGGKVGFDTSRPGITAVRGSIYPYTLASGRTVNVVPTIHPAAVMRQASWEKRCLADWRRIASLVDQPYEPPPERHHHIHPTVSEVEDWANAVRPGQDTVGLDIETWGGTIQCIGLGTSATESIVIPTTPKYWGDIHAFGRIWEAIKYVVENPNIDLLMQNGLFDSWWLEQEGLRVAGYHWDTLAMHHCIDPLDNHSLDYMASIYTRQPYWKDEAKSAEEIVRVAKNVGMDRLYVYNGLDVTVMYELFEVFHGILLERDMLGFYLRHYADMHEPLLGMMRRGVRCDRAEMEKLYEVYHNTAVSLRDEVTRLVGKPLYKFDGTKLEREMIELYAVDQTWLCRDEHIYPDIEKALLAQGHKKAQIMAKWEALRKKNISDKMLGEVLFDEWKAPRGSTTATGRYQVDNVALKTCANRARQRVRLPEKDRILTVIDLVLEHRRANKLGSFLNTSRLDADDRMRCEYRFATRSGRLASRENPRGTGANLQNYDRSLKAIFTPRPGHVLVEVDLSQAESRVVKILTGSQRLCEMARLHPSVFDEHTANAAVIFSALRHATITPEEITYEERQLGKRVVHATNYAMGKVELSRVLLKETGDTVTPAECQLMLDAYSSEYPEIAVYQSEIRRTVMRTQQLYTSWGRQVNFHDIRRDDELYKFAYSYIPQSEIAEITNQWGLQALDKWINDNSLSSAIVLQVHDSLVIDCPPEEAWYVMNYLDKSMSRARQYGKCLGHDLSLSIPCEFAVGGSWKMEKEWKLLPTADEILEISKDIVKRAG